MIAEDMKRMDKIVYGVMEKVMAMLSSSMHLLTGDEDTVVIVTTVVGGDGSEHATMRTVSTAAPKQAIAILEKSLSAAKMGRATHVSAEGEENELH